MDQRTGERSNVRTKGRTNGPTNKRPHERTNGITKERTEDEQTDGGTKEGTDGRKFQAKITCANCIATAPAPDLALTMSISVSAEPSCGTLQNTTGRGSWRLSRQGSSRDSITRSCHTAAVIDEFFQQKSKQEVPVPVAPAPLVRFVTAPAPDLALTSSISVPAEPYLPYSAKHYRKRKLEAEQAGEFRRQYNKKLSYRTCNIRIIPTDKFKPEVPVPVAPAPLVRFVTAPAPDLALTSSISVPAEPY
ncbi:hypothetical protein DPMN_096541 [Dreissena polymorpha]|uniref:Uncharacterized protein n=1 Tax=Dreissena polymorpha TaxID=45954 RepID=A0A9D4L8J2_DREPO|nr:hypothetical protein DPMN_096541 [Dreissena polymorpha]